MPNSRFLMKKVCTPNAPTVIYGSYLRHLWKLHRIVADCVILGWPYLKRSRTDCSFMQNGYLPLWNANALFGFQSTQPLYGQLVFRARDMCLFAPPANAIRCLVGKAEYQLRILDCELACVLILLSIWGCDGVYPVLSVDAPTTLTRPAGLNRQSQTAKCLFLF